MRFYCLLVTAFVVFVPMVPDVKASLSCAQPAYEGSVVCSAAQYLDVSPSTVPRQLDGYEEITSNFKHIRDLTSEAVRKFVQSHPSNTEFLIKYLSSLDDYYLSDQRKVFLVNAALHELFSGAYEVNDQEEPVIAEKSRSYTLPIGSQRTTTRMPIYQERKVRESESPDQTASKKQNIRADTFDFDFSVGTARFSLGERSYFGQSNTEYSESIETPFVSIKKGLFHNGQMGFGLKFYDSYQNEFTISGDPAAGGNDLHISRDWSGGLAPIIFYDWRSSFSPWSIYAEYGESWQSVDYKVSGTENGVPYTNEATNDFTNRTAVLGIGYNVFDSWLLRATHQWVQLDLGPVFLNRTGIGIELQSDF